MVSAYKRRIRWLWALAEFLSGFLLFFPHLYFLIHSNSQSIRQAFAGGLGESVPLIRNVVNLIKIFAETSFAGGFGFFFQRSQFETISLSGTPLGFTHPWLAPFGTAGTLGFLLLFIVGLFVRMKRDSLKKARIINTYLHPDEGCEFAEQSAELPPPSPLRICISPGY